MAGKFAYSFDGITWVVIETDIDTHGSFGFFAGFDAPSFNFTSIKLHLQSGITDGKPNSVIDDVYIANTDGTVNNDFLGDVAIDCYLPQEQILDDHSDSTYISEIGALDTYEMTPLYDATPSYPVFGVMEWVKTAGEAGRSLKFVFEEHATPVLSAETTIVTPEFKWYGHAWEYSNDATPIPLTPTTINDSEFGIEGF